MSSNQSETVDSLEAAFGGSLASAEGAVESLAAAFSAGFEADDAIVKRVDYGIIGTFSAINQSTQETIDAN